jgi:hypothetical protein
MRAIGLTIRANYDIWTGILAAVPAERICSTLELKQRTHFGMWVSNFAE